MSKQFDRYMEGWLKGDAEMILCVSPSDSLPFVEQTASRRCGLAGDEPGHPIGGRWF